MPTTSTPYSRKAATAFRDQVLNHHHLGAFLDLAFNLVAHTVIFRLRTNVGEGQTELVGYQCALGNGTSGHTSHRLCLWEMLLDGMTKLEFDEGT